MSKRANIVISEGEYRNIAFVIWNNPSKGFAEMAIHEFCYYRTFLGRFTIDELHKHAHRIIDKLRPFKYSVDRSSTKQLTNVDE